jgi:large subunit ribosomal protein L21
MNDNDYAIIRADGRQYKVLEGTAIHVDRLDIEVGGTKTFDDVLLVSQGDTLFVGNGSQGVEGARVITEVQEHGRDKKIVVFKYKAKTRYRKKQGHRQGYTKIKINKILAPGQTG